MNAIFFVSIVIICWPRGREHTRDYWKEIWEGYYKIGFELQPAKVKIFTLISDLQWNQEVTALDSVTNGSMCFACCNYLTFPNVLAVFICINSVHFEFVLLVSGEKNHLTKSKILPEFLLLYSLWLTCSKLVLPLYTLTSVCIFSILFARHFLRCWRGEIG